MCVHKFYENKSVDPKWQKKDNENIKLEGVYIKFNTPNLYMKNISFVNINY